MVLTADHGEELFDHGGWKHGQTLYEEQIHVPLIFRWDGRIQPGTRLRGTVRLVDLVPTIAAAVGMGADPEWDGVDLLPALTGKGPLPRRPAFAQHLTIGPLRAAAVLERQEADPLQPAGAVPARGSPPGAPLEVDTARLQRVELYDLARDPGERRNLVRDDPRAAAELAPAHPPQAGGVAARSRVLPTEGVLPGSRLSGTITFQRAPQRWVPYFLGEGDRVEMSGNRDHVRPRRRRDRQGLPGGRGHRPRHVREAPPGPGPGAALAARGKDGPAACGGPRDRAAPAQPGIHPVNENRQPPGWTERVRAESALVVAPHYDDEVLGCGGLAAQLAAAGAAVRVLFLTDGSGGVEEIGDRDAYRARRQEEAANAVRVLGLAGCDTWTSRTARSTAIFRTRQNGLRRALAAQRPDLLLVPHRRSKSPATIAPPSPPSTVS